MRRTTNLRSRLRTLFGLNPPTQKAATPLLDFLGPRHRILERRRPVTAEDLPDADALVATWWRTAEWVAEMPASKGNRFYLIQDYEAFANLPVQRVISTYHLPLVRIAVSGYIRDEINRKHGVMGIHVVPNSVDIDQFSAPSRSKQGAPTVGFLYTSKPRKNVGLAIEAIQLARQHLPDLKVVVFGATAPKSQLPLPSWVEYHQAPPQADIPKIYAACDAWLFTSEKEGFGLPILEAMACRTPVLATRAGAAPDLIDGINGTLLPSSAEAFAAEILRFARMPEEDWKVRSDAAWRTATSHCWEVGTDRLLAILSNPDALPDAAPEPVCETGFP
jgi:glycosyltransferase involved in cell wall biosynthesis